MSPVPKVSFTVRCSPEDKARWESAAQAQNRSLNNWIETVLNSVAVRNEPQVSPKKHLPNCTCTVCKGAKG